MELYLTISLKNGIIVNMAAFFQLGLICFVVMYLLSWTCVALPVNLSSDWQAEISKQASNYAQHVARPFLIKQLVELHVPSLTGQAKTFLGKVSYDLNKIKISSVDIKTAKVSVDSSHGISMCAEDASFLVAAQWKYNEKSWPHISDAGTCNLVVDNLSLGLTFNIDKGENSSSPPSLKVKECNLKIGSLKIKFKGGTSWLYNLFSKTIADDVKAQLQNHICTSVNELVDAQANKILASLPVLAQTFHT